MKDIFRISLHVIGLMQIDHSLEFSTSNALTIYCIQGYVCPSSLANSFISFWICPDIVVFKENKSEILAFAQSKFAHWQQRRKEQNNGGEFFPVHSNTWLYLRHLCYKVAARTAFLIISDLEHIWITGRLFKLSPSETLYINLY